MALANINKQQASRVASEKFSPRLLMMSATVDSAAQYMNYMNVFFTAQKLNIPLDTCMILQDSGLLQQGSDITGGLYVKVEQLTGLLQYLTWLFLPWAPGQDVRTATLFWDSEIWYCRLGEEMEGKLGRCLRKILPWLLNIY